MLRWGGVRWGKMLPSCEPLHILDATLPTSSLDFHTSLMLRWGGVGWGKMLPSCELLHILDATPTTSSLDFHTSWCYATDIFSRLSSRTRKHRLKIMSKFAFGHSETHILQKQPPKMTSFFGHFWNFKLTVSLWRNMHLPEIKKNTRTVSGPEGFFCI